MFNEQDCPSAAMEKLTIEHRRPTLTERLTAERKNLAARIDQIDEVLRALAGNPDTERVINLVSRI